MLWVGQFGIVNGEAREQTPWVGVYPDPGHADETSDIYLIVEPALPGSEEFCEELKEVVGSVFHKEKVSLTGGMLRALRSAHEQLREWNQRSLKEHRIAAGVSCAAISDRTVYLGQVAPCWAAYYRDGRLAIVKPTLLEAAEPLGLYDEFLPEFSRVELKGDGRLLLLSPALAESLAADDLTEALALSAEETLPALYRKGRSLPNCGAILVAAVDAGDTGQAA